MIPRSLSPQEKVRKYERVLLVWLSCKQRGHLKGLLFMLFRLGNQLLYGGDIHISGESKDVT